ncbi:MAG: pantetheine-phosphate adenylyltransferase [Sporichthyaceae bacterium]
MRSCVVPGSFDPVTNGHVDVIARASKLADEVVVAVLINRNKQGLFTITERLDLLQLALKDYPNVRIDSFQGLLVDYCQTHDIPAIVKGLRVVGDFDYEVQMAQMNHTLTGVETLLVATNPLYSFLSSSLVKEVANNGADITGFVPDVVVDPLLARLSERRADQGR